MNVQLGTGLCRNWRGKQRACALADVGEEALMADAAV